MKIRRTLMLALSVSMLVAMLCASAMAGANGKKAILIVAKKDFEQTEYTKTRNALEDAGVVCTVASTKTGTLRGNKGKSVQSDMELENVKAADYDAVVVIGGNGIKKLWKNSEAHRIVQEAATQGKVLGAICAAPGVLAYAKVLDGKKATAHPKSGAKQPMQRNGCEFKRDKVVVDGKLITANGPKAASGFGEALVKALN